MKQQRYTQNSNLQSSGYCMPFSDRNKEVIVTKTFTPSTPYMEFQTDSYLLQAVADGIVCGAMNDREGASIMFRHEDYTVKYGGLKSRFAQVDQKVKAGNVIGMTGKRFRIEVTYLGNVIDPVEFLTMIYGNMKMLEQSGKMNNPNFEVPEMDIPTDFDDSQEEVERMMLQWYPDYLADINTGAYTLPMATDTALRNVLSWAAMKQIFFRTIPHLGNPGGLDDSAIPIACKVQNLLIADFLNYMVLRHQIFLTGMNDDLKKKAYEQAQLEAQGGDNEWFGEQIDPLEGWDIDIQSFDIPRVVSVYPDRFGVRWFTKAWFNNSETGEASEEITVQNAIRFILDLIDRDEWLEEYYPTQMEAYRSAISQTREQLLKQTYS